MDWIEKKMIDLLIEIDVEKMQSEESSVKLFIVRQESMSNKLWITNIRAYWSRFTAKWNQLYYRFSYELKKLGLNAYLVLLLYYYYYYY